MGFGTDASLLPRMSWGDARLAPTTTGRAPRRPALGLYAIVDDASRVVPVIASDVRTLQLRIKAPPAPAAADSGVDGVCVVRGLGADPAVSVPRFQQAIASASGLPPSAPAFPLPSLDPAAAQGVAARRSSKSGVG